MYHKSYNIDNKTEGNWNFIQVRLRLDQYWFWSRSQIGTDRFALSTFLILKNLEHGQSEVDVDPTVILGGCKPYNDFFKFGRTKQNKTAKKWLQFSAMTICNKKHIYSWEHINESKALHKYVLNEFLLYGVPITTAFFKGALHYSYKNYPIFKMSSLWAWQWIDFYVGIIFNNISSF